MMIAIKFRKKYKIQKLCVIYITQIGINDSKDKLPPPNTIFDTLTLTRYVTP